MTNRLAERAWVAVPEGALVLVPVGSTEQHGPHLPLDTDSRIATAVAEEAARLHRGAGPVLVAPVLAYAASGEHQSFPGTMSIGHEALEVVLTELVRSLSLWARRIVIVNGHGGNVSTLARTVPRLVAEGRDVAWLPCAAEGDAHAGRTETSLMLHLDPGAVDLSAAVAGNVVPVAELMASLTAHGVRFVSPSGILGDPTGASADEGRAILEAMAEDAARRIDANSADAQGRLRDPAPP
ncbi:mycofactocin biosynthesis peptidyl-dipeptidase MftE [Lacisediminihabitans profunda]|uniref:Mycofactocin biosynthesis peptidyl-dipeptidase MftE n=1 Tax=Lacisediminihabitans profunda TaxID=2594790 RepID=A0A5C8USR4_9MICO|nr:mycofactocin biosynthesis peptidyl-dipeptidase MftE [Lacisediminihabitans profunda]TXN31362.1 mycofactocin biosynthesis peptidyl-dipeptidase MftE [Lacisediminihabitans profunda]